MQRSFALVQLYALFLPVLNRRNQRAHAYPCRAKVIHLVNFQRSINFACRCQNRPDFVRRHSVQPAAKGIKLHKLQILLCFHEPCRFIQAGMVCPLVTHHGRPFHMPQMRHAVLCQHGNAVARYQLRDTMVNFRVCMVGPPRQHNARHIVFADIFQRFFALFLHIAPEMRPFLPALLYGRLYFLFRRAKRHEFLRHTLDNGFDFIEG